MGRFLTWQLGGGGGCGGGRISLGPKLNTLVSGVVVHCHISLRPIGVDTWGHFGWGIGGKGGEEEEKIAALFN